MDSPRASIVTIYDTDNEDGTTTKEATTKKKASANTGPPLKPDPGGIYHHVWDREESVLRVPYSEKTKAYRPKHPLFRAMPLNASYERLKQGEEPEGEMHLDDKNTVGAVAVKAIQGSSLSGMFFDYPATFNKNDVLTDKRMNLGDKAYAEEWTDTESPSNIWLIILFNVFIMGGANTEIPKIRKDSLKGLTKHLGTHPTDLVNMVNVCRRTILRQDDVPGQDPIAIIASPEILNQINTERYIIVLAQHENGDVTVERVGSRIRSQELGGVLLPKVPDAAKDLHIQSIKEEETVIKEETTIMPHQSSHSNSPHIDRKSDIQDNVPTIARATFSTSSYPKIIMRGPGWKDSNKRKFSTDLQDDDETSSASSDDDKQSYNLQLSLSKLNG